MKPFRWNFGILAWAVLVPVTLPGVLRADNDARMSFNQWVRLDDRGDLVGRVIGSDDAGEIKAMPGFTVAAKSRDGKILRTTTDNMGDFRLESVAPGVYAITSMGDGGFACCALHVLPSTADSSLPARALLQAGKIDVSAMVSALDRYLPTLEEIETASIADIDLESLKPMILSDDLYRVEQTDDGGLAGQVFAAGAAGGNLIAAADANVFLFRGLVEIERGVTDAEGKLFLADIAPGHYSMLVVGAAGVGVVGFELVGDELVQDIASRGDPGSPTLVQADVPAVMFAMQLAPPREATEVIAETLPDDQPGIAPPVDDAALAGFAGNGLPAPGGAGGGGFAGGGGAGGFGGGFGRIAAIGGIAAAIALAADDDDDEAVVSPTPVSPVAP